MDTTRRLPTPPPKRTLPRALHLGLYLAALPVLILAMAAGTRQ